MHNVVQQITIVLTSLGYLANLLPNIFEAGSASERMMKIISREPKTRISVPSDQPVCGSVRFEDVTFRYQSRPEVDVLKRFSLEVPIGSTVALVGSSGCGKSTIIRLMERFYDPCSGDIYIGGNPISSFPLEQYHDSVRLVGQEPMLFDMTIAENIMVGLNQDITVEEAMELITSAARRAHAHGFIMEFPDGYNQMVGEKGARLSGGQKQRIAIARALISNPNILLLDEATSALDSESEQAVQQSLDELFANKDCTAIVVAHRLSTITNADKILVMEAGQIVEIGTHQELIAMDGLYATMVEKQRLE